MKLISQATFLDPRFKKQEFPKIAKFENPKTIWQKKYTYPVELSKPLSSDITKHPQPCSSQLIWNSFDKKDKQHLKVRSSSATVIIETDKYLNETLLKRTEKPLKW